MRLILRGRVQGVGFRHFTILAANALGLRGTVRNAPDGTVEVRVAGAAADLESFRDRLRQGPAPARVDAIDATDLAESEALPAGFEVRY